MRIGVVLLVVEFDGKRVDVCGNGEGIEFGRD